MAYDPLDFFRPRQGVSMRPGTPPPLIVEGEPLVAESPPVAPPASSLLDDFLRRGLGTRPAPGVPAADADPDLPAPQFGVTSGPSSFDRFRESLAGSMGAGTTAASPAPGAAPPSFDRIRDILGQDIGGRSVPLPQIFNEGAEQNPMTALDFVPRRPGQAPPQGFIPTDPRWDHGFDGFRAPTTENLELMRRRAETDELSEARNRGGMSIQERTALRNSIIGRHNLTRDLEMHQRNMGRGLFTNEQADRVARSGVDPRQGIGTAFTTAGAAATNAGANLLQAQTGAAQLEAALSGPQARQRFATQFSNLPPAQIAELIAAEEARGGFAPRRLQFPIGAAPGASPLGSSPPAAPQAGGIAGPAGQTVTPPATFLSDVAAAAPTFADIVNRAVPKMTVGKDVGVGELMMRLQRSNPAIFATEANRTALLPYLESRYGRNPVAQAMQGTRRLGPIPMFWGPGFGGTTPSFGGMTQEQEGRAMLEASLGRNQW